jgi:hypothetical protein
MYYSLVAYCTTLTVQTSYHQSSHEEILAVRVRVIILDVPTFATSRFPRDPSSQRWNYVGEKWPMNFASKARLPRSIQGSFTCRKSTTWDRRLYFPSEGRRAEDFFSPEKIRRLRPGLNPPPRNLGTKGQHATSRPPKPLTNILGTGRRLLGIRGAYFGNHWSRKFQLVFVINSHTFPERLLAE